MQADPTPFNDTFPPEVTDVKFTVDGWVRFKLDGKNVKGAPFFFEIEHLCSANRLATRRDLKAVNRYVLVTPRKNQMSRGRIRTKKSKTKHSHSDSDSSDPEGREAPSWAAAATAAAAADGAGAVDVQPLVANGREAKRRRTGGSVTDSSATSVAARGARRTRYKGSLAEKATDSDLMGEEDEEENDGRKKKESGKEDKKKGKKSKKAPKGKKGKQTATGKGTATAKEEEKSGDGRRTTRTRLAAAAFESTSGVFRRIFGSGATNEESKDGDASSNDSGSDGDDDSDEDEDSESGDSDDDSDDDYIEGDSLSGEDSSSGSGSGSSSSGSGSDDDDDDDDDEDNDDHKKKKTQKKANSKKKTLPPKKKAPAPARRTRGQASPPAASTVKATPTRGAARGGPSKLRVDTGGGAEFDALEIKSPLAFMKADSDAEVSDASDADESAARRHHHDSSAALALVESMSAPGAAAPLTNSSTVSLRAASDAQLISELHRRNVVLHGEVSEATVQERYAIGPVIGVGSQGAVHRVVDKQTRRAYAMKVVKKDHINDAGTIATEIEILKSVRHMFVANLHEVYETGDRCWFIMELIDGGELIDWIRQKREYTEADVACVMEQLLYAIRYLHENSVVHRDIKLDNLLFKKTKNGVQLKLADFGLSGFHSATAPHSSQRFKAYNKLHCKWWGTPGYMAPEVMRGSHGPMCDVFSAGVVMHVLLSGEMPFGCVEEDEDDKIERLTFRGRLPMKGKAWAQVTEAGRDLVRLLLQRDPSRRLSAAEALQHPFFEDSPRVRLGRAQRTLKEMYEERQEQLKEDVDKHVEARRRGNKTPRKDGRGSSRSRTASEREMEEDSSD